MISKHKHKGLTWLDLECPTTEEVRQVMNEWNLHPLVAEELSSPTLRPKVEIHPNFIYLILHFPVIRREHGERIIREQEIDFVIGKDFIITARYDAIDPLHQFSKLFEVNSILDKSEMGGHAGFVFFYMLRNLYDALMHELESINDVVHAIEEKIFKGRERAMVARISEVSRELLDVRRATRLHKEILESFDAASRRFFGEEWSYYSRAIIGEYYRVHASLESAHEAIAELRETNNSLLNARETEVVKTITLIAFLTLPASLITNFFQLTTTHTPIIGTENDWLVIMIITCASTVFVVAVAKLKRWF